MRNDEVVTVLDTNEVAEGINSEVILVSTLTEGELIIEREVVMETTCVVVIETTVNWFTGRIIAGSELVRLYLSMS